MAEIMSCALGLLITAIVVTALVILLPNSAAEYPLRANGYNIKVMISVNEDSNFKITTENPVTIKSGENAVFGIELSDGYKLTNLGEGLIYSAEEKTITVVAPKFPRNVNLSAVVKENYRFAAYLDMTKGSITTSAKPGKEYEEGTKITVTTIPKGDNVFIGYSLENYMRDGGVPIAYSSTYEFEINQVTRLYANFASEGAKLLFYNANGGKVAGSNNETICTEEVMDFYLCPNTLPDKGYFEREGYVLYGYNTKADGTGTYYGCGWNVIMDDANVQTLYAQWIKETPQTEFAFQSAYDTDGKKYAIIREYYGDDETVVIPLYHGELEVRGISKDAFASKNVKTVYLNRNITTIQDEAFKGCKSLETIYIYDKVTTMTDKAFAGCEKLKTAYVQMCIGPKHTSVNDSASGSFSVKYERLITTKGPKIVLMSGSSSTWGLNTPKVQELIGDKYTLINYGTNAFASSTFYLQFIANYVDKDDVVLIAPEPMSTQLGDNDVSGGAVWRIMECCYDAIIHVDLRTLKGLWNNFASSNAGRIKMEDQPFSGHSQNANEYGDYIKERGGMTETYSAAKVDRFNPNNLTEENIARLNVPLDAIAAKGAKVWISFSPYNMYGLTVNSEKASTQKAYENKIASMVHGELISTIEENLFSGKYFVKGNDIHMSSEGAIKRSEVLASIILRKINSVK